MFHHVLRRAHLAHIAGGPAEGLTYVQDFLKTGSLVEAARCGSVLNLDRPSVGLYHDSSGDLVSADADVPRFQHYQANGAARGLLIEPTRTNSIRNNTMVNAVEGTPGTLPTNWYIEHRGVESQVVGLGTIGGIDYIDIRFFGTPSGHPYVQFEGKTDIDALTGEDWTAAGYVAVVGGDTSGFASVNFLQVEQLENGGHIQSNVGPDISGDLTGDLQHFTYPVTLSGGATTAHVRPLIMLYKGSGEADITLRIGLPQEEKGKCATSPIRTVNAGTVTRQRDQVDTSDVSCFNRAAGTLFAQWSRAAYTDLFPVVAFQKNGVAASGIKLSTQIDGIFPRADHNRASGLDVLIIGESMVPVAEQTHKIAFAYAVDDLAAAGDGEISSIQGTDDSTQGQMTSSGIDRLNVGMGETQTMTDPILIEQILYWNIRKSNEFIRGITA